MPLLRKESFLPEKTPVDLDPATEVFLCTYTNEVFTDYEAFFERSILCNSLVWSCSITGKSNLTYEEAAHSEMDALKVIYDTVSPELRRFIVYLTYLTRRKKFNDIVDDVHIYLKDRYIVGEPVEAIIKNKWYACKVDRVIPPTEDEVEKYKKEQEADPEVDQQSLNESIAMWGSPPELFRFEVTEEIDEESDDLAASHTVRWSAIRREKGFYTRDKLKMYVKYVTAFDKETGFHSVRAAVLDALDLPKFKFDSNFPAKIPKFEVDTLKGKALDKVKAAAPPKKSVQASPLKNGKLDSPQKGGKAASPVKNGKVGTPMKESGKTPVGGGKTPVGGKILGAGEKTPAELKKEAAAYETIPDSLKKPLIYLLSLFRKFGINSIFEELYQYVKDRMFVGEDQIEAIVRKKWRPVRILEIVAPTQQQIDDYSKEQDEDPDINKSVRDETLRVWGPQPELFSFVVEETEPDKGHEDEQATISWDCIKREKMALTREKLRLMTRYVTYFDEEAGHYKVKDEFLNKFNIGECNIRKFFSAKEPEFEVSIKPKTVAKPVTTATLNGTPVNKKPTDKTMKKPSDKTGKKLTEKNEKAADKGDTKIQPKEESSLAKKVTGVENKKDKVEEKTLKKGPLSVDEVKQMEDEMKRVREQREKLQEERLAEKHRKLEEKKRQAEILKEFLKPKEDLELEDLKDLPQTHPVHCHIPNALFGDFLMVLEFLHVFSEEIELKDDFTHGVTFDLLERAVVEKEVLGPFNDILQVLLRAVFSLQEQENEEVKEDGAASADNLESKSTRMTYGAPLQKLSMDALTITEMLRLHILQSGSKTSDANAKWRFQQRGGYTSEDDPGYQFKLEEPQILQTLATQTVFELSMCEKLKILRCLSLQILTYAAIRDVLDERFNQLHSAKNDLRNTQYAENKRQRELVAEKAKQKEEDKTRSPPLTAQQIEARSLKWDRDDQAEKVAFAKNQARLKELIDKLEGLTNREHLGLDRAYRRYWNFSSFPGLFVEHDDEFVGPCLPVPTPSKPQVIPVKREVTKDVAVQQKKTGDIRNYFGKKDEKLEAATVDDDVMVIDDSIKEKTVVNGERDESEETGAVKSKIFGLCTANPETCPVHATYITRTAWSYVETAEEVDQLIQGLNERGVREHHLKKVLEAKKEQIKELIATCPVYKLDDTKEAVVPEKSKRAIGKKYDPTLGYPEGTPIYEILETELRDMILDMEDKVYVGLLGELKVKDREVWRTVIQNKGYDRQTDKLKWGGRLQHKGLSSISGTPMKDVKVDRPDSRGSEASFGSDDGEIEVTVNPAVKDLACALLQVSQGIQEKFLKKPLGEEEKDKKKRLKAGEEKKGTETGDSPPSDGGKFRSPRERWEISLLNCTSFSQLFLHYSALDASIEWKKSAEKVRCRMCRKQSEPEKLLLCDSCGKGCHTFCLKPPLAKVPEGDWFCKTCQPKEKPRTPRKARRLFSEEEAEESGEEENEEEEVSTSEELEEVCTACSEPGEVILCDTCPNMYHLTCLDPPLRKPPRGKWSCPDCLNPRGKRGKARARAKTVATDKPEKENRKRKAAKALEFSEDEANESDIAGRIVPKRRAAEKAEEKVKTDGKRMRNTKDEEESDVEEAFTKQTRKRKSPVEDEPKASRRRSEPIKRSAPLTSRSEKVASKAEEKSKRKPQIVSESEESEEESTPAPPASKRKRGATVEAEKPTEKRKSTESAKANGNNNMTLDIEIVEGILDSISRNRDSWPFMSPVKKSDAPDYHKLIKNPMDLGTVRRKLYDNKYRNNAQVFADVLLVFHNCERYNMEDTTEYKCGVKLRKLFEKQVADLGFEVPVDDKETKRSKKR